MYHDGILILKLYMSRFGFDKFPYSVINQRDDTVSTLSGFYFLRNDTIENGRRGNGKNSH